ncbi:MAG: DNA-processing protein DprA [Clostridia bacterium]|nr:DNA-processing protein DprA [Clostridia bacterium]
MEKYHIKVINITDEEYPQALREIYAPPITLFAKGDVSLLGQKSISVVGCRRASNYGLKMAKDLAYCLAKNHIVIVSGLAKGIDAMGHLGALEANGKTIAVLGCGVDICYPRENLNIYKKILENGLILSEYIVGTEPKPQNFPIRNRIVSGLSNGVVVVEAREKSGSLITADLALEQGREVYVLPGNVNSPQSAGTNALIKQGAKLITSAKDILEDM